MNIGLSPIEWSSFAALSNRFAGRLELTALSHSRYFRLGLAALAIAVVAAFGIGFAGWRGASEGDAAENPPPGLMAAVDPETVPPQADTGQAQPSPLGSASVDGLKILSQHWRRAGLGSNALFTFTLRNGNEYAVKDIEISCVFSRGDGSHLTDRSRVLHETVRTRGRKTFTGVHVGFVNVNAERAKCSPVGASRI